MRSTRKIITHPIFTGDAVLKNLHRNGFVVSTIYDIYPEKCKGYCPTVEIKSSPKAVAQESDIIVSGRNLDYFFVKTSFGSSDTSTRF